MKSLSAKKYFYLFIVGIFILSLIVFQFGIKNTILLLTNNQAKKEQLDNMQQNLQELEILKNKNQKLDKQIGARSTTNHNIHQEILNTCSDFCINKRLFIKEYPEEELISIDNSLLRVNWISLQGGFHNSLEFIYQCETGKRIGNISSVCFEKKKNTYTQVEQLLTTLYFSEYVNK